MKIAVFGCGYVGLTTAVGLAEMGNQVIGVDIDQQKIDMLNNGSVHFYEPGLHELLIKNIDSKRIRFTMDAKSSIKKSAIVICAVATPKKDNHETDLGAVLQVAKSFANFATSGKLFINKSTVPVGTSEFIRKKIQKLQKKKINFSVVSNPEFLKEGSAVKDFFHPDRIIIGLEKEDNKIKKLLEKLYRPIEKNEVPLFFTSLKNAELIKYASNAFLSTKISFANELANYCDLVGGDIKDVMKGTGLDPRIGSDFLEAGIGFGGSCLPKDLHVLLGLGEKIDFDFHLLKAVKRINDNQPDRILRHLETQYSSLKGKCITIWGLSFKPNTNDLRDAPSISVVKKLLAKGMNVTVFDPVCMDEFNVLFGDAISYAKNAYSSLEDSDALAVITEWNEFKSPDFSRIKKLMKSPVVIDARNIYSPMELRNLGFVYYGIGTNS